LEDFLWCLEVFFAGMVLSAEAAGAEAAGASADGAVVAGAIELGAVPAGAIVLGAVVAGAAGGVVVWAKAGAAAPRRATVDRAAKNRVVKVIG
jgi:hypothetical protein